MVLVLLRKHWLLHRRLRRGRWSDWRWVCKEIDATPHVGWWSDRSRWFGGLECRRDEKARISPDLASDSASVPDLVIWWVSGLKWWSGYTVSAVVVRRCKLALLVDVGSLRCCLPAMVEVVGSLLCCRLALVVVVES